MAHSILLEGPADPLLNASAVSRLWDEHQSGLHNRATELWTLLMYRLWQKQFGASI